MLTTENCAYHVRTQRARARGNLIHALNMAGTLATYTWGMTKSIINVSYAMQKY